MKERVQGKEENSGKFRRVSHVQTSYNRCNFFEKSGIVSELSSIHPHYTNTNIPVDYLWDGQNVVLPVQEACSKYRHRWESSNT